MYGVAQEPPARRQEARTLVELFLMECEACVALARHAEARRALGEVLRWRDRAAPPTDDPLRGWYLASVAERMFHLARAADLKEDGWVTDLKLFRSPRGEAFFTLWIARERLLRDAQDADATLTYARAVATALTRRDARLEAALCVDLAWVALRAGRPWDAQDELTNARSLLATRASPDDAAVFDHLAGAIADALPARIAGAA